MLTPLLCVKISCECRRGLRRWRTAWSVAATTRSCTCRCGPTPTTPSAPATNGCATWATTSWTAAMTFVAINTRPTRAGAAQRQTRATASMWVTSRTTSTDTPKRERQKRRPQQENPSIINYTRRRWFFDARVSPKGLECHFYLKNVHTL